MLNGFGVYQISNVINNHVYVGATTMSFEKRWGAHKSALKNKIHANQYLQEDWDKYGIDSFRFIVLEKVNKETDVIGYEQKWLSQLIDSGTKMYNIRTPVLTLDQGQMRQRSCNLTEEEVQEIKAARSNGNKVRLRKLAKKYHVTESAISRICTDKKRQGKRRWKNPKEREEWEKRKAIEPQKYSKSTAIKTIKVWETTWQKLRLIAAHTDKSMVAIIDEIIERALEDTK